MKKLTKVRYDQQGGTFKIVGENSFGKNKTAYIDIENAEEFINAIKLAIQKDGEHIELVQRTP